jgi:hypothetical protein
MGPFSKNTNNDNMTIRISKWGSFHSTSALVWLSLSLSHTHTHTHTHTHISEKSLAELGFRGQSARKAHLSRVAFLFTATEPRQANPNPVAEARTQDTGCDVRGRHRRGPLYQTFYWTWFLWQTYSSARSQGHRICLPVSFFFKKKFPFWVNLMEILLMMITLIFTFVYRIYVRYSYLYWCLTCRVSAWGPASAADNNSPPPPYV